MTTSINATFKKDYENHLKHLKLKGLAPKTRNAYDRAIRQIGEYFEYQIRDLTKQQLLDYFSDLAQSHSWSAVIINLSGLKFFYRHALNKDWTHIDLVKPPKTQKLPDVLTIEEVTKIFEMTNKLSYKVYFFVVYSLGLRKSEGLNLKIGDIDAQRMRVHIRDSKRNKDRFVPLPEATLHVLRRFWAVHRHPELIFPNRAEGLQGAATATTTLGRVSVGNALRKVLASCGIKKKSVCITCGTVMRLT